MPLMRHNKKMKSHFLFIVILNDYPDVILNNSEESCSKILRSRSG